MSGSKYPARAHAAKVVSELAKLIPEQDRTKVCGPPRLVLCTWLELTFHRRTESLSSPHLA